MKNKAGVLAAAVYMFPLIWHWLKNMESLSLMNSSQSKEGDMNGNQSAFFPCEPQSSFGAYCISDTAKPQ